MDMLLQQNESPKRNYKIFIIGGLIGLVLIAGVVGVMTLRPSMADQESAVLEGSFLEGTPEFEQLTREIVISTEPQTVQSPNAFGSISMYIVGKIRNKGQRAINGLEINVAVVDQFNQVVKQRRVLVVPKQQPILEADSTIPVTLTIDGFKRDDDRANIRWKVTAIRTTTGTL